MTAPRFVQGSTLRHVAVMTGTSTLSLLALFVVELVDMFFLSLLGEVELAAAIGYAGSILFFTTAVCIGLSIASAASVARALGRDDAVRARRLVVNAYAAAIGLTLPLTAVVWLAVPWLLALLGAEGRAAELATSYLRIIVPSMPVLAWAMASNGVLRATGDARRSMTAMLAGSGVNGALDPVFIFALDLGVDGAALASVAGRLAILALSFRAVTVVHGLAARFDATAFRADLRSLMRIAVPAILTNVATPVGNAVVIAAMAAHGDSAVAGAAIISRLSPVAFAAVFALSAAVGPVVGQNHGAGRIDRVARTLRDALLLAAGYVVVVSSLLWLLREPLVTLFDASGEAASLLRLFCPLLALAFVFHAATFVTNAAFNNLDRAHWATIANFGKATLGTVPFVAFGSHWFGAAGVLGGQALGAALTGVLGVWAAHALLRRLAAPPQHT